MGSDFADLSVGSTPCHSSCKIEHHEPPIVILLAVSF